MFLIDTIASDYVLASDADLVDTLLVDHEVAANLHQVIANPYYPIPVNTFEFPLMQ